ncbi:hypothetical protein [Mycobacterium kyorinense]|uniref:Apea-like HEPN domain-containing protein n=1 Tax=Mycobacterium kyorinense TaxID=487514 RepID=A0A1X1YB10_9MYCO|nr:hypothetical protein [Mycobacterium kyorinense]ORW08249.1 hypothetical protein AWC14_23515 [Mycobacterium kyorinense]
MTYSFHNRLVLSGAASAGLLGEPNPETANVEVTSVVLANDGLDGVVELCGPAEGEPIQGALELRLTGRDFPTFEAAHKAGIAWRNHLTIAFAHYLVGIKIGSADEPVHQGFGTPYYQSPTQRRLRDDPGLLVFETDKRTGSGGLFAEGYVMRGLHGLVSYALPWIISRNYELSSQQSLAYGLVHAAYFEDNPETSFILLVTAIEALLPPREAAPHDIAEAIDALKQSLNEMTNIDDDLRQDVAEALEDDKFDPIGRRARQLVSCLGTERFAGQKPKDYFHGRYKVRSGLVHGSVDRLTEYQLSKEVPELRRFVLALLGVLVFGERMPEQWTAESVQRSPMY